MFRYLEELESKLRDHQRLQARIQELESKLREVDPSGQLINGGTGGFHHNLTPPEISVRGGHPFEYITSASVEFSHDQSTTPEFASYAEKLALGPAMNTTPFPPVGDVDPDTNPGVFEAGDAGKGWYLGCASGSTHSFLCHLQNSGLHELYQKHCVIRLSSFSYHRLL